MPRRRPGGLKGRIALLHAVAHIELNAIDLAWDFIARMAPLSPPVENAGALSPISGIVFLLADRLV